MSYETQVTSVNDGNKIVTTVRKRQRGNPKSEFGFTQKQGKFVHPNSWNNMVFSPRIQQVASNEVQFDGSNSQKFSWSNWGVGYGQPKIQTRKLRSTARNVEPPAQSVDTGGNRPGGNSVAGEIAKVLNIKQGYYSDIYDQFDRPAIKQASGPVTTKRPADMVEEAARRAVVMMFQDQDDRNSKKPRAS